MSEERALYLLRLTITQRERTRDYTVSELTNEEITGFDEFADLVRFSQQKGMRNDNEDF
jgi:hypothetical protein